VNKEGILLSRRTRKEITLKKYIVDLDERERNELEQLTTKGSNGARKIRRARILLLANEGRLDKEIASFLGSTVTTVEGVRKRFVEEGLEAALSERPKPGRLANSTDARRLSLWRWPAPTLPKGKQTAL
jgi:Winged helix-turn helix